MSVCRQEVTNLEEGRGALFIAIAGLTAILAGCLAGDMLVEAAVVATIDLFCLFGLSWNVRELKRVRAELAVQEYLEESK